MLPAATTFSRAARRKPSFDSRKTLVLFAAVARTHVNGNAVRHGSVCARVEGGAKQGRQLDSQHRHILQQIGWVKVRETRRSLTVLVLTRCRHGPVNLAIVGSADPDTTMKKVVSRRGTSKRGISIDELYEDIHLSGRGACLLVRSTSIVPDFLNRNWSCQYEQDRQNSSQPGQDCEPCERGHQVRRSR
jgi:hypothetical protein